MKRLAFTALVIGNLMALTACSEKNYIRTGHSMDRAYVVQTPEEQRKYLKAECADCTIKKQSIVTSDFGKQYDKFILEKPNGEKVTLYFDVSHLVKLGQKEIRMNKDK